VPLTAGSPQVTAYLRRAGDRAVLVVANLGATPARGVTIASASGAFPAGSWTSRSLLGGPAAAPVAVAADGVVRGWVPFATLPPNTAYVLELSR
ncbi:MAG TPA: hypothetical protein VFQ39_08690, partial [Longimicrobium sp.]|nr:hypothetical protein [Longimicrobium sp.]